MDKTDFQAARAGLVNQLSGEIRDRRVLDAMSRVPRELFLPPKSRRHAYEDRPLPIGHGQTISQPLIVAMMTEALELTSEEKVLEVGTGSGYQAAVLAELCRRVISVERLPALSEQAGETLRELGYDNITLHIAGEKMGWNDEAPYPAIIVTAGAPDVPGELLAQLEFGGRMVIPVGSRYVQQLCKITRQQNGNTVQRLGGCHFVDLIGKEAWN